MDRVILHVDANCFYASCECLYNPEIRNKPVAVVGDSEKRHGIILTANYIAKRQYGIKTGEVIWQAQKRCPSLVLRKANMPLYLKFSRLIRQILLQYSDRVENFGCDEAWVDVTASTKIFGSGFEIAKRISDEIKYQLGITVSIGVSFNKIFAKLGSDYKKPDAITVISKENFRDIVWRLPVGDLLLVGRKTCEKLYIKNIKTIGDLANTNPENIKKWLGKSGLLIRDFANGIDESEVKKYTDSTLVKSIGNSTTLFRDLKTSEEVKMVIYVLADSVARRMREQELFGNVISLWIKNNQLSGFIKQEKIEKNTNLERIIAEVAFDLFCKNYNWSYDVRAVGVSVSNLMTKRGFEQMTIDEDKNEKIERLENVEDEIKRRFGSYSIRRGILIKDKELTEFDPKITHTVHPVSYF